MGRPRTIGDVQPFALLSKGPRTRVYKGYQPALDRFVLLKVLVDAGHDEALARRFEEEARLVARVEHPNVVAVHACGRDDGRFYLVAEFVEGRDLGDVLESAGALPLSLAAFVAQEAARGLKAAHDRDVLHRDLKPANLLLSADGRVKVADFGMASLHGAGEGATEVRGTPAYLAPEQVLGEPPAPPVDVFALGATLYEMLSGRPTFTGTNTDAVLDAVLHHDPMAVLGLYADVPAPLRQVCAKLLEKAPADRYSNAAVVIDDLEHARRTLGFTAGQDALAAYLEDPPAYRPPVAETPALKDAPAAAPPATEGPGRRRTAVWVLLGLLLLAGLGYAGAVQWDTPESGAPPTATGSEPGRHMETSVEAIRGAGAEERSGEKEAESAELRSGSARRDETRPPAPDGTPEAERPARRPDSIATHARASLPPLVAHGQPGERTTVSRPEEPATGRLRVTSVPWAVVYVDGDSVGVTPMTTALALPAGTHRLTLKHPRLPAYEGTIRVAPGRLAERSVSLWKQVARLSVEVAPWAEVLVNGAVRDTTPLARPLVLAPGTYTLTLRHPALGAWKRRLHLRAGEERAVSVNLLRQ